MTEVGRSSLQLVSDSKPARLVQYFTVFSVTMGALSFGTHLGFMSPAKPALNETLNAEEMMWFSSIVNLGAMTGGPVAGLLINVLGRRGTMMASVVLSLAGWALIGTGN
ncbi:putative sugar transporter ERD6-like 13 [Chionoecetes opilio]|uniref:Putative sugar transporter ERD6-like 13 n=1 Tax=Chionoecetes opilio TaxID=41210 RepID=A0A8J4YHT7_CHIOP|nr:putative sugar transporter ERD6-like 13 [Chionoecetes opilio]